MSNLVDHARVELGLIGEDPETIEGYLKVIQAFVDMGHSGGSAMVAIPVIHQLLQFNNLKPLTTDPEEWFEHPEMAGDGKSLWQNKRNGAAFSKNGGVTYSLVDEPGKIHYSRPPSAKEPATSSD